MSTKAGNVVYFRTCFNFRGRNVFFKVKESINIYFKDFVHIIGIIICFDLGGSGI